MYLVTFISPVFLEVFMLSFEAPDTEPLGPAFVAFVH
jgi:hypothetical protein